MSVFRVEKSKGDTVMSNHHLRNHTLSLKAKGLLSQMLSLPEDWDYTLQGLAQINKESIDAIREAVRELERAGYIKRSRERDERGCLRGTVYTIYEQPHAGPTPEEPTQEKPTLEKPMLEKPTLENPTQLNTKSTKKRKRQSKDSSITTLDFIQTEPVSDVVKETTYRLYFISDDNEKISNENIYIADKKDKDTTKRVFRLRFSFKNKKYDRSRKYYLVAFDDKNDLEVLRHEIIMDIAFADDFGFGF